MIQLPQIYTYTSWPRSQVHRVIIIKRGSMFAFQWREFSPPLSSAHRQKRDRRRCNSRGTQNTYFSLSPPPPTRAISQWASSLEWRHAVTLHILVGKICIIFFLFYCEGILSLVVLWPCGQITLPPNSSLASSSSVVAIRDAIHPAIFRPLPAVPLALLP